MRPTNGLIIFLFLILLIFAPITLLKRYHTQLQKSPSTIPIILLARAERKIYYTDLENYLIGVVAAEMPAKFSIEALKAQAIAARTIAVNRLKRFGGRGCQHYYGVDFCDDPNENQAWLSVEALKSKWAGENFAEYYQKIVQAIRETAGIIMVYHNQPIDAVFHSTCGVGTADAMEVWHHQIPYLKSRSCGYDRQSPRYRTQVTFTWSELSKYLHLPQNSLKEIRVKQRSNLGRVIWLSIGKSLLTGEDFRKALNLNSTCFTWQTAKNGVTFQVIGYGHGVGMCQYGADGMAKNGWNYRQILNHYYRGIQFCKIKG